MLKLWRGRGVGGKTMFTLGRSLLALTLIGFVLAPWGCGKEPQGEKAKKEDLKRLQW